MTRLALAKTLVSGTVTLQGIAYSFTASATGSATGSNVPVAQEAAIIASNTAATTAARASIDKILLNNSAVLSDLEITSLISNNFTTTVKVFIPIGLATIATTTDGINYYQSEPVTIEDDRSLTIPNGKNLISSGQFTNNGRVQIGEGQSSNSNSNKTQNKSKTSISGTASITSCHKNKGTYEITSTGILTIGTANGAGVLQNDTGGYVVVDSGGSITIDGGQLNNRAQDTYVRNNGTITMYGTITDTGMTNYGKDTVIQNNGTLTNNGACISNYGKNSSTSGTITGTQPTTSQCTGYYWCE